MHLIHVKKPIRDSNHQRILDLDSGMYYDYEPTRRWLGGKKIGNPSGMNVVFEGAAAVVLWEYLLDMAIPLDKEPDALLAE